MQQYKDLIRQIFEKGEPKDTRSGKVLSLFGPQVTYDLREGFPLVTTKKTLIGSIVKELLWILRAETNTKTLGCGIWDEWQREDGELGPIYGAQFRSWDGIDQIANLIKDLKENPFSRRHIVSAWNVAQIEHMALPPCHAFFQLCVGSKDPFGKYYLDLKLTQRSGDVGLGVPFNTASYSILLTLLAREADMTPRYFIHSFGDAHIYENHFDGMIEVLQREPLPLPKLIIANKPMPFPGCPRDGSVLEHTDITVEGYKSHPFIRLRVAP
jgi:thymidylate synthase